MSSHQSTVMEVRTNTFCSSGMHLPNGSYVTFGGNGAVGPGGALGSQPYPGNYSAMWDNTYQDFDGTKAIRILNPCSISDLASSQSQCQWFDDPTILAMKTGRWYSAAEALGDGTVIIIGGFANGGYINRNTPNIDPENEGGAAIPTYEYYPPKSETPPVFQFLVQTSGLNAYVHTFLMPSGKLFVQANISTSMWLCSVSKSCNSLLSSSFVGSRCQCGNPATRYAWWGCSCISCLWCGCHATSNTRKQLYSNNNSLWWIRHA